MATLHTIKIDEASRFHVDEQDGHVNLSFQSRLDSSHIKLDPNTAKALGAALYLTAETVAKVVPA